MKRAPALIFFPSVLGTSEQNKCLQAAVASALTEDTSAADAVMHAAHRQCFYTLLGNVCILISFDFIEHAITRACV